MQTRNRCECTRGCDRTVICGKVARVLRGWVCDYVIVVKHVSCCAEMEFAWRTRAGKFRTRLGVPAPPGCRLGLVGWLPRMTLWPQRAIPRSAISLHGARTTLTGLVKRATPRSTMSLHGAQREALPDPKLVEVVAPHGPRHTQRPPNRQLGTRRRRVANHADVAGQIVKSCDTFE